MKWIDLPPIWTIAALLVAWGVPMPRLFGPQPEIGGIFLIGAALLIFAALFAFARARTTVIPRQSPSALITSGIFRLSRNPIYLADLLILAGISLIWGNFLGVALVPALAWVLTRRFIEGEETRLAQAFPQDFAKYRGQTRRWI